MPRKAKPDREPSKRRRAPTLDDDVIRVLLEVAHNMRANAYAPYSTYRVGAALLAASGNVYGGCNVENASYGLTICAERGAIAKAVSEGETEFVAIAIVTSDGGSPCGACRQVLAEFGEHIIVAISDERGRYQVTNVAELLPLAFHFH